MIRQTSSTRASSDHPDPPTPTALAGSVRQFPHHHATTVGGDGSVRPLLVTMVTTLALAMTLIVLAAASIDIGSVMVYA